MDGNKFLPKLSQDLLEILDDDEYYDVNIEVGNDPYVKIFHAHTVILNYRSPYLRRILSTNKKKNYGTLVHIKLPNILPEIFHVILRFIYGGKLSLRKYDASDIFKILVAASELSLQELIVYIQSFLIKKKANWIEQNFNLVFQTSFEDNSFLELQKFCTELISKKPEKIFKSSDFISISENLLISLIQHNNLQMNEIQVWKCVIQWGLAQNPELPPDFTSFSKNDLNVLKNTLQQCIPFIRFHKLTSKEFLNEVFPYREILPEEFYVDLLRLFLDHDYKPSKKSEPRDSNEIKSTSSTKEAKVVTEDIKVIKPVLIEEVKEIKSTNTNIDSKIITIKHAELISKWVDKLNITDEIKSSSEFKLVFRASRDGPNKFHQICDNTSHTVTIVKLKGSSKILGGYNPITWNSNLPDESYSATKDSFIFSLRDKVNILSRVKNEEYAICYCSNYGPTFGAGDLILYGDMRGLYRLSVYEKPIREVDGLFFVEEYEVFQIVKD